jgi:hypothetical protein
LVYSLLSSITNCFGKNPDGTDSWLFLPYCSPCFTVTFCTTSKNKSVKFVRQNLCPFLNIFSDDITLYCKAETLRHIDELIMLRDSVFMDVGSLKCSTIHTVNTVGR